MIEIPTSNLLIADALKLSYALHHGQVDKAGMPYIFHPYNVAMRVKEKFNRYAVLQTCADEQTCIIAALLHDTVEDTSYTIKDVQTRFGDDVSYVIKLLTKMKEVEINDYYKKILPCNEALIVKLGDLEENMRQNRIPNPIKKDAIRTAHYERRYIQLYEKFKQLLSGSGIC